jgi:hypothetical protein
MAEWKRYKQCARRPDFLGMFADEADRRRHQTVLFKYARQHTDRVRAQRSSAGQKNHVDVV